MVPRPTRGEPQIGEIGVTRTDASVGRQLWYIPEAAGSCGSGARTERGSLTAYRTPAGLARGAPDLRTTSAGAPTGTNPPDAFRTQVAVEDGLDSSRNALDETADPRGSVLRASMTSADPGPHARQDEPVCVIWREGTWRCEAWKVRAGDVLRVYDWDTLESEEPVTPDTIAATSAAMRQSVREYLATEERMCRPYTIPEGRSTTVFALCPWCLSRGAVLTVKRPSANWYFCPDCSHHWHARPPMLPLDRSRHDRSAD
jgi:hypothetical protein